MLWSSSSSSSVEEDDDEEDDEEPEEDEDEDELLDFDTTGIVSIIFLGRPRGRFPFLLIKSSFSCSLLLNATNSLGSRRFS